MSQSTTLSVPSISCDHCKNSIEGALRDLDGVESATVSVDDKTVAVSFDDAKLSLDQVKTAIEDQGYDIEA